MAEWEANDSSAQARSNVCFKISVLRKQSLLSKVCEAAVKADHALTKEETPPPLREQNTTARAFDLKCKKTKTEQERDRQFPHLHANYQEVKEQLFR